MWGGRSRLGVSPDCLNQASPSVANHAQLVHALGSRSLGVSFDVLEWTQPRDDHHIDDDGHRTARSPLSRFEASPGLACPYTPELHVAWSSQHGAATLRSTLPSHAVLPPSPLHCCSMRHALMHCTGPLHFPGSSTDPYMILLPRYVRYLQYIRVVRAWCDGGYRLVAFCS